MEQMYQTQAKTLSETLSDTLQKGFGKYQTNRKDAVTDAYQSLVNQINHK